MASMPPFLYRGVLEIIEKTGISDFSHLQKFWMPGTARTFLKPASSLSMVKTGIQAHISNIYLQNYDMMHRRYENPFKAKSEFNAGSILEQNDDGGASKHNEQGYNHFFF